MSKPIFTICPSIIKSASLNCLLSSDSRWENTSLSTQLISLSGLQEQSLASFCRGISPAQHFLSPRCSSAQQTHMHPSAATTCPPEACSCPIIIIIYSEHLKHLLSTPLIFLLCKLGDLRGAAEIQEETGVLKTPVGN